MKYYIKADYEIFFVSDNEKHKMVIAFEITSDRFNIIIISTQVICSPKKEVAELLIFYNVFINKAIKSKYRNI